jgi:hypothetical protein
MLPQWINRDSSIDVSVGRILLLVAAPCFHGAPRGIGARRCESVSSGSFGTSFIVKASTASRNAFTQTMANHHCAFATRTLAQPVSTLTLGSAGNWLRGTFNHLQPSKYLAGQVDRS